MTSDVRTYYANFRKDGMRAHHALHAAKAVDAFRSLESEELVKIDAEPEEESYFDVYGKPDTDKEYKSICDTLDRLGCWWVVTSIKVDGEWEHVDSIGMCMGYQNPLSPRENWYVPDLMRSAVDAFLAHAEREEHTIHA